MKSNLFLILILVPVTTLCWGQTDPDNVPKPPTEKLKIFEPYFGSYEHTMEYGGLKFKGTMEVKPIIKGWYVDWTILTKTEDEKIDREYHMLVTWDDAQNKYRVWRFETTPHEIDSDDISLRTEGTDIIVEAKVIAPNGNPAIFYNRYTMPDKNQVEIITEGRNLEGQKMVHIGTTTATRIE